MDLSPLADIKTLVNITGRNTKVNSLQPLANLPNLESADFRKSPITTIEPLFGLMNLKYLNVDHANIPKEEVVSSVFENPELNIIFRSVELEEWWRGLDETWKSIFKSEFGSSEEPNLEELHAWTTNTKINIESKSVSNFRRIRNGCRW